MTILRIIATFILASTASGSFAQASGATGERGSIPLGSSRDGSRPSEGAITGGSVLSGEAGGVPNGASNRPSERDISRCKQLTSVLREECLRDLGASSGGTRGGTETRRTCDALIGPDKERCLREGGSIEVDAKSGAGGTGGGATSSQ
jgi:hypothetical protein